MLQHSLLNSTTSGVHIVLCCILKQQSSYRVQSAMYITRMDQEAVQLMRFTTHQAELSSIGVANTQWQVLSCPSDLWVSSIAIVINPSISKEAYTFRRYFWHLHSLIRFRQSFTQLPHGGRFALIIRDLWAWNNSKHIIVVSESLNILCQGTVQCRLCAFCCADEDLFHQPLQKSEDTSSTLQ